MPPFQSELCPGIADPWPALLPLALLLIGLTEVCLNGLLPLLLLLLLNGWFCALQCNLQGLGAMLLGKPRRLLTGTISLECDKDCMAF